MSSKNRWYLIHATLVLAFLTLAVVGFAMSGIAGAIPCVIIYYINDYFRDRCLGFYYKRRELFGVDIIDTGWEPTEEYQNEQ